MAQHDYNLANQSGADFRADLNNALAAIATVNSGATEPSTTFAHQLWVDTASSVLKIRNAADTDWITLGTSITTSNTFIGDLTGNVTGDLTGNAGTATTLETARTISLSGDVVGSVSFDGSANVDISTVVQINSIVLGVDTTGDYVESISGGTGVTITGGTGEGSTPVVAIDSTVATLTGSQTLINKTLDVDSNTVSNIEVDNFKATAIVTEAEGISSSDNDTSLPTSAAVKDYVDTNVTAQDLDVSDGTTGIAIDLDSETLSLLGGTGVSSIASGDGVTFAIGQPVGTTDNVSFGLVTSNLTGQVSDISNHSTSDLTEGTRLYYTTARSNTDFDTRLAIKDTDSLSEGTTNLYYTTARVDSDFDTRLATKDTSDLTEGSNLYYTTARANTDFDTRLAIKSTSNLAEGTNLYYTDARFDTRLATKDTDDLTEGSNLYYTSARFDSAFTGKSTSDLTEGTNLYYTTARANSAIDTRVNKAFVDALNIQAASVDANSVALGIDTTGNYVKVITGTANKITVTGSGIESADVTITLPDDVQIADSLTVAGNLTVNGTLTSLDTTNLDIEDNLFQLNAGLTGSPVNDSGMLINRGNLDNSVFMWDESADKFTLGLTTADGSATGNITLNSLGTLVANIEGAVTGNVTGTVSDVSNHDTDDISEGSSNLYYTDARADARVNLQTGANLDLSSKSTSDLSEGTNEYFTTARARSSISATGDISYNSSTGVISFTASAAPVTSVNTLTGAVVLTTANISENTNLYYTDARARAAISESSTQLAYNSTTGVLTYTQGDTDTVSEGTTNLYYTTSRFDSAFSGKSTTNLTEGTNLYFTDARAEAVSINNVVEDTTPQLGGDLASNGNDILFADNDKAIFGAGSDLQIYHDGSHSYVQSDAGDLTLDVGGDIILDADGREIKLKDAGLEFGVLYNSNGDFGIYSSGDDKDMLFQGSDSGAVITALTLDMSNGGRANFGNDIGLSDDRGIRFGAGDDLSIFHDGNNSYIRDSGTGSLIIQSNSLEVKNASGNESVLLGTENGAVTLYHDNAVKLATTSTGVDVTGTAGVNALDIKSGSSIHGTITTSSSSLTLNARNTGIMLFQSGGSERMRIDNSGNVGIGATSMDSNLHIIDGTTQVNIEATTGDATLKLESTGNNYWNIFNDQSDARKLKFEDNGNGVALTIQRDGNVGIGTSSPSDKLEVKGAVKFSVNTASHDTFRFTTQGLDEAKQVMKNASGTDTIILNTAGVSYFNGGNVGIGTSSPTQKLDVNGTVELNNLTVAGAQGSDGQVLTSTGSGIAWEDAAGGGVAGIVSSANATAMTINSSEQIGIGTTSPSAPLHLSGTGSQGGDGVHMIIQNVESGGSPAGLRLLSDHGNWEVFNSKTVADALEFIDDSAGATRMLIDSSGRVGINRTPSVSSTKLEIGGADDTQLLLLEASGYTGGLGIGATGLQFFTDSTVRGKFDQTGEFLVNRANGFGTGGAAGMFVTGRSDAAIYVTGSNSSGYILMAFYNGGLNEIGSIKNSNNNATLYNTSSDYRLKENVDYTWDATTRLKQLKPARFNWISDEAHTTVDGFLAHEVSSIVPEAIDGVKDATKTDTNCVLNSVGNLQTAGVTEAEWVSGKAETPPRFESDTSWTASHTQNVYQAIDQSKLVPLLVKTIQELEARITALES